jgi:KaiC/GvpD/RAD55 family RecA-like ATPase
MATICTEQTRGLLAERSANEWMREAGNRAAPRMLFGEFWLEAEMAIMFGGAGSGKSVLAMQIAESLARGRGIEPIGQQIQGQKVLYFDLDLDARQFGLRYSRETNNGERSGRQHRFSNRLRRIEVDLSVEVPEGYSGIDEYLAEAIEAKVRETGAKILIFDNINRLKRTCESIREALPMMQALKRLQRRYGLSILVLAQTSRRATTRGLDITDLPGGKLLSNFADNVFAIGESRMYSAARYLKQIGPKSTDRIFGVENVPTFGLEKIGGDFLGFRFWWFAREREHLVHGADRGQWETLSRVKTMAEQGMSIREIAVQLNRSKSAVHRLLRVMGIAESRSEPPRVSGRVLNTSTEEPPEGGTQNAEEPSDDATQSDLERWKEFYRARREAAGSTVAAQIDPAPTAEPEPNEPESPPGSPQLIRQVNDFGTEIWVESFWFDGRPAVWYRYDRKGRKFKHVRGDYAIVVTEIKEEAAEPSG